MKYRKDISEKCYLTLLNRKEDAKMQKKK